MRDIICKTITDEMIESAIAAAFQAGYTSLKMYFMIGLPRETHLTVPDGDGGPSAPRPFRAGARRRKRVLRH